MTDYSFGILLRYWCLLRPNCMSTIVRSGSDMPSRLRKQKDTRRVAYIANSNKVRAQRSLMYYRDLENERARAKEYLQASYSALSRVKRAERKAHMLPRLRRRREPSSLPLLRERTTPRRQRSEQRCGCILKTPMPARRQRSEHRCGRILKTPKPARRQRSELRCGRILKVPMLPRLPRAREPSFRPSLKRRMTVYQQRSVR